MEAILQKWLRGPGRTPRSWTTLVDALRETPVLSKLVQELEEHFGKSIDVKPLNKGHLNGTLQPEPPRCLCFVVTLTQVAQLVEHSA